jgi:hypothetical protein
MIRRDREKTVLKKGKRGHRESQIIHTHTNYTHNTHTDTRAYSTW